MSKTTTKQHIQVGTESFFKSLLQKISTNKDLSDGEKVFTSLAIIKKMAKGKKILLDTLGFLTLGNHKRAGEILQEALVQENIPEYAMNVIGAKDDAADSGMIHLEHVVFLAKEDFDEHVSTNVIKRYYEELYSLVEVVAEFAVKQLQPYPKTLGETLTPLDTVIGDETASQRIQCVERFRGRAKARFLQTRIRATIKPSN